MIKKAALLFALLAASTVIATPAASNGGAVPSPPSPAGLAMTEALSPPVPGGAGSAAALSAATSLSSPQENRFSEALLESFTWRSVGPPGAGGRIVDVEVVGAFPHTIFVAGATGGLWRSTNNGVTFEPIFDHQATNSIGAIAVHPSNPDVIWVGTGENNARNSVSWGDGVYKTTDGGRSWSNFGLRDSHHIGDILIDPTDPQTVYVAALGHIWGANDERGVYKTGDGGATWERVLYIDEDTGVVDLDMDPADPQTLYAAAYQVRRDGFAGGDPATMYGPGGGIHKTSDGGRSWKELTRGLPRSQKGRIGLATTPADPEVVYAIVQTATTVGGPRDPDLPPDPGPSPPPTMEDGGVFRSNDRGESFEWVNSINPRPFYYSQVRADPSDPGRVWVLGSSLAVSDDGGESFETVRMNVHVDHHDLWIDPADPDHLVLGNDGGLYISYDRGTGWDFLDQMALGQFYAIDVDMQVPYHIYGGVQDYMSWGGPSATRNSIGITAADWYKVMTGDGFQVRVDPTDTDVIFAESQGGGLIRHDRRSGQNTRIQPQAPDGEQRYRFNWETPIHISFHDPATIYMGGNHLFRSRERGNDWEAISPDLTTHTVSRPDFRDGEPQKVGSMTAFAESPLDRDLLFAGTDDGNVWMTRDGGANWIDLTEGFPGLAGKRWVSRLVASRFDARRAYAAFDGHRSDDFAPHVYVTLDAGESWASIAANLPDDQPVRVIREDVVNPDLLFLGTELGAWVSLDRGGSWMRLMNGMPTVAVADLVVHPRDGDLIAGTHGRSAFVMDISPLQELTAEIAAKDLHLFSPKNAVAFRYRVYSDDQFLGEKRWVADNPPYGATISYLVADGAESSESGRGGADAGAARRGAGAPDTAARETGGRGGAGRDSDGATITIRDAGGRKVRELRGPADAGLHRVQWDLRHGPWERPEAIAAAGAPNTGGDRDTAGAPNTGAAPNTSAAPETAGARVAGEQTAGGRGRGGQGAGGGGGQRGGGGRGGGGPLAQPGDYQVTVAVGDREETTTLVIEPDPELARTEAERLARWNAIERIRPLQVELGETGDAIDELESQLQALETSMRGVEVFDDSLREKLTALLDDTRMLAFRHRRANGLLSGAYNAIESSPFAPTATHLRQVDEAVAAHAEHVRTYDELVATRVPALVQEMDEKGIPRLIIRR
ncbi:MAG TPA: hypothetical protein VGD06_01645 [Acidobacteriota bacterium]